MQKVYNLKERTRKRVHESIAWRVSVELGAWQLHTLWFFPQCDKECGASGFTTEEESECTRYGMAHSNPYTSKMLKHAQIPLGGAGVKSVRDESSSAAGDPVQNSSVGNARDEKISKTNSLAENWLHPLNSRILVSLEIRE
ncbi:hypothetical protein B0H14DRAFT_2607440 [Mycena olivaceomarginata]|nr:hypothetical protein B0H14DRAFT_2607440 [Mycena olivaceomarginata]